MVSFLEKSDFLLTGCASLSSQYMVSMMAPA